MFIGLNDDPQTTWTEAVWTDRWGPFDAASEDDQNAQVGRLVSTERSEFSDSTWTTPTWRCSIGTRQFVRRSTCNSLCFDFERNVQNFIDNSLPPIDSYFSYYWFSFIKMLWNSNFIRFVSTSAVILCCTTRRRCRHSSWPSRIGLGSTRGRPSSRAPYCAYHHITTSQPPICCRLPSRCSALTLRV